MWCDIQVVLHHTCIVILSNSISRQHILVTSFVLLLGCIATCQPQQQILLHAVFCRSGQHVLTRSSSIGQSNGCSTMWRVGQDHQVQLAAQLSHVHNVEMPGYDQQAFLSLSLRYRTGVSQKKMIFLCTKKAYGKLYLRIQSGPASSSC